MKICTAQMIRDVIGHSGGRLSLEGLKEKLNLKYTEFVNPLCHAIELGSVQVEKLNIYGEWVDFYSTNWRAHHDSSSS